MIAKAFEYRAPGSIQIRVALQLQRFDEARQSFQRRAGEDWIMFGIFKKKQPTVLDGVIRAIYGDNPPAKTADLERAIYIAHEDLLAEQVPISEVRRIASPLLDGAIPYSTYDLSAATALSFFKNPELFDRLKKIQIAAGLRVLNWMKDGKVPPLVLKMFEDTLYRLYKPSAEPADGDRDAECDAASEDDDMDDQVAKKYQIFKDNSKGTSAQVAANVVRDFIFWQLRSYQRKVMEAEDYEMPDEDEPENENEKQVKRAFTMGAIFGAIDAFSLPEDQWDLFFTNVIGICQGTHGMSDHHEIGTEMNRTVEAGQRLEKVAEAGTSLITHYLVNGKEKNKKYGLAIIMQGADD
jgi:hypothetical protein